MWFIPNGVDLLGHRAIEEHTNGVIWELGKGVESLNALVPPFNGWWIEVATDIDDRGQICGWEFDTIRKPKFETRWFFLTPIDPEMVLSVVNGRWFASVG